MKNFTFIMVLIFLGLSNATTVAQGIWSLQNNPTSKTGESLQFVSATEGWISLSSNQLLHTTNSGGLWSVVTPSSTDVTFGLDAPGSRISFINPSTGWIMKTLSDATENVLGTVLYKTTDNGTTWSRTVLSTTAGDAGVQVQFVDENNGWALIFNMNTSSITFLKTTDGGANWTPTNGGGIFYYVNTTTGYAFSAGPDMPPPYYIMKTTDGGTSWTAQYVDNTVGELNAIEFTDANNGWIVGRNGKIFHTINGGTNWTQISNSGYNINYKNSALSFINNTTGWIASKDDSNGNHFTLSTTDGGLNWSTQTLTICDDIFSMDFWDATHGWATSDSGPIAKYSVSNGPYSNATLNGPWLFYRDVTPIDPFNDNLMYFVFDGSGNVADNSGFGGPFTGNYTVSASGEIAGKITNGSDCFLFGGQLTSTTEGTAIVVGQNWRLHKIANPGALTDKIVGTLSTPNCGSKNVTFNIDSTGLITSATGLAGPVVGRVYADLGVYIGHIHTGETPYWREIAIWGNYSNNNLIGRIGLDDGGDGYGFACGGDRTQLLSNLVRSDNTPLNSDWTLQTNPLAATANVGKIQFVTATEGWISISSGGLLHTTNGGTTWTEVPLDLPEVILSSMTDPAFNMCFINPLTGWVLKSFGTDPFDSNGAVVYKTTNGGLNWQKIILSQVPKDMGGQIQFIDENNGYASIVNTESGLGKYYKTTNGGATWSLLPSDGTVGILYSVDLNNAWGILGTFSQTPPFRILHSNNGMASFTVQWTDNTPGAFWAIQFTDLNHGWVVGQNGKILKTTDGGVYWETITNAGITSDYTCKSVYFINATTGWIGAQFDNSSNKITSNNYAIMLHTKDGGISWTTQTTPTRNPFSIFFWDENNGWFTSDDNKIARYSGTLSIKENAVNKYITIYPNPNNGTFYFSLKEANSKVKAEIFTLSGQKVFEASNFEMQPQNEINFTPQTKGIYLIKITDGANSYIEKIMIRE